MGEGEGEGEGAKSYDGEKAWFSIKHKVHSGSIYIAERKIRRQQTSWNGPLKLCGSDDDS